MAVSSCVLFLCTVSITFSTCTAASCYYNHSYGTSYCSYYSFYYYGYTDTEVSTATLVGAFSGAIVGFIVFCVVIALVSSICCKKKPSPGTIIHPAGLSTVTLSSAAYMDYPVYPHLQMQGWGLQPGSFYSGRQQPNPTTPLSKPLHPLRSTQGMF
ncbi:uncharacterized protein LOC144617455 [Crassostrea virginica]|uniref:Uncharacterized protein LOC111110093 isoform X2 n=1 Tax=Crassostrea virginica TaxID=6565 RepID=A0A8B8BFL9_CRAVI|nr:uncharacterized protein LOC111110093 isoform X2 [Crassostrea virginica]